MSLLTELGSVIHRIPINIALLRSGGTCVETLARQFALLSLSAEREIKALVDTIVQTVPQMVMNLIDFRMDVQQAIAAPRISFAEPDVIAVDSGVPDSVRKELSAMGHNIRVRSLGNAHGLTIEYDAKGKSTRFTGGADPRGEGAAIGLGAISGVEKAARK